MMWRICVVIFFLVVLLFTAKNVLACKGNQVLFEDNFTTLDPSWGESDVKLNASNGKLVLKPGIAKRYQSINQGTLLQDMDACIKVSLASSDDPSWGGGFIFWASDHDNYYWLAISGNGWFTVQRRSGGQDSASVAWVENAAVKKGVGQWNSLRVVTKGTQATVYINDVQVATFQGQPPQGGSMIGVFGDSPDKTDNTWEFSDLKITNVVDASSPVTVIPSPVAKADAECKGQVLYEDNFATLDPAWGESNANLSVNNGRLIIKPEASKRYITINQANVYEDMNSCVSATLTNGDDPSWAGGFVFWAKDYDNYYTLSVNGNGWVRVERRVNGRELAPVSWRENGALKKGLGEWNSLRLATKTNQATVYINGAEIITFKGQPPEGGSFIGFFGDSPTNSQNVWEFTGLKITKP